jgi:hypothetical protein
MTLYLRRMIKMYQCAGSGSHVFGPPESASESVSWRYRSEDPDPYQYVTDPQHWQPVYLFYVI